MADNIAERLPIYKSEQNKHTYKNAVNRQQCPKYAQQVPNHVLFCDSNMLRLTLCIPHCSEHAQVHTM